MQVYVLSLLSTSALYTARTCKPCLQEFTGEKGRRQPCRAGRQQQVCALTMGQTLRASKGSRKSHECREYLEQSETTMMEDAHAAATRFKCSGTRGLPCRAGAAISFAGDPFDPPSAIPPFKPANLCWVQTLLRRERCAVTSSDLAEDKARFVAPGARDGAVEELLHFQLWPAAEHSHCLPACCPIRSTQLHGQEMIFREARQTLNRQ